MRNCIIFCAGEFDKLCRPPEAGDLLIAADGGLAHANKLGLVPDIILGDFDSLGYVPEGAELHPIEKDDTDSMLAIKKGLQQGCDIFYLYGALDGGRVDHTMANFQALQYLSERGARGYLVGLRQTVTAITSGTIRMPESWEGYLSVFCLGSDCSGVSIRGARYELENATLTSGFPLGVSNRFVGKRTAVTVEKGTLLLIWDTANGVP